MTNFAAMKYPTFVRLGGGINSDEDLKRILPPPWQIVPRSEIQAETPADESVYVLVAVPDNVTTPREQLEQALYAVLDEVMPDHPRNVGPTVVAGSSARGRK
jgi:hypothetical protein